MSATASSKRNVRLFWSFLPLAIVAAIFTILAHAVVHDSRQQQLHAADAIVVFGAAQYDGRPSPVFKARLDHADELFRRGLAPIVITTGGPAADPKFSEGGVGRDYLVSRGVPDGDIIAETQSSDTSQSAARVANILRANGLHNCLAVSDGYHMFRVKQMLERQAITVYASPRPDSRLPSRWERMRVKLREVMSYTAWRLGL